MNPLLQIQEQFGFAYPSLYHQLYADGMLDWGTFGPEWITKQFPELRKRPPLLLFANEFELMPIKDIQSQLEEFADPDYWMNINPALHFIPFAQNGAGDMFCFLQEEGNQENMPIAFLWHDANRAVCKAKNLQDFIFRSMLEAVADIEEPEYGLLEEENFREDLGNFLSSHQPYLSPRQYQIIAAIYSKDKNRNPLISEEELEDIIQKEIAWDRLDTTFPYQTN
ncbi:SMI1/KNR4 family protein [Pseudoflavitalea sp. G-6-1-2]|uniref:SMI1/KNR4 family protein n=1 Tax=Pseudoflavitalea sp. G-6-1-2 TaxID=2728841 RepID=UPI00146D9ADA|nr:SMI1/KNR4 family protein [Pseudoflavitalea sp. G-6-1-2]NML22347.1 SMI1/KNR4 family protein [Pseudoflavitalea sp. G-6-1-2]